MKRKLITLSVMLLIAGTCTGQSIARQVISNAGDYQSTADFSISYTIGEPVIETFISGNTILLQGFHQGDELITIPESIEDEFRNTHFQIYPNPARDQLLINITQPISSKLKVKIYSITGKLISEQQHLPYSKQTFINLSGFPPGTYILKIAGKKKKKIKTFKLIKQ